MKKFIVTLASISVALFASSNVLVKLTEDTPYVNIKDNGVNVKIMRIQDTANRLTDDFAKTSRVCPPHCVTPIKPVNGVKTISELELIDFIKHKVYKKKGILVDARDKKRFLIETIPGAINIPDAIARTDSKKIQDSLFKALGAKIKEDGSYDFSNAKDLAIFCSGLWCGASVRLVNNLAKEGYPKDKLYYYRGGLQAWKLLGLTTVVHNAEEVKK